MLPTVIVLFKHINLSLHANICLSSEGRFFFLNMDITWTLPLTDESVRRTPLKEGQLVLVLARCFSILSLYLNPL